MGHTHSPSSTTTYSCIRVGVVLLVLQICAAMHFSFLVVSDTFVYLVTFRSAA